MLRKAFVLPVVLGLCFLVCPAREAGAGLVIREQEYASDEPDLKSVTITELQKNRIRFQEEEDIVYYVWDLAANRLTQVNMESKVYASGTFDEEIGNLRKYLAEVRDQYFAELKESGETIPPKQAPAKPEAVRIEKTTDTAVIAGYKAVKFTVRRGEKLLEELWLSKDLNVIAEIDYPRFKRMYQSWMNVVTEGMAEMGEDTSPDWLRSEEYLKLFEEGYALKQIEYLEEGTYISEVVAVDKKDLPEADFKVPEGYRQVTSQQFMEGEEE